MAKCLAITAKGTQCQGLVRAGSDYCPAHDPNRAEARRASAQKAGRSKVGTELHSIRQKLIALGEDVLAGAVDKGRASVAAQCWGVAVRCVEAEARLKEVIEGRLVETGLKVEEQRELIKRLEELESLLAERKEASRWGT